METGSRDRRIELLAEVSGRIAALLDNINRPELTRCIIVNEYNFRCKQIYVDSLNKR